MSWQPSSYQSRSHLTPCLRRHATICVLGLCQCCTELPGLKLNLFKIYACDSIQVLCRKLSRTNGVQTCKAVSMQGMLLRSLQNSAENHVHTDSICVSVGKSSATGVGVCGPGVLPQTRSGHAHGGDCARHELDHQPRLCLLLVCSQLILAASRMLGICIFLMHTSR